MSSEDEEERIEAGYNDALMRINIWVSGVTGPEGVAPLELSREDLAVVFREWGAKPDVLTLGDKEKLGARHYSTPARAPAMKAVWGEEKYKTFKHWCEAYGIDYETRTGHTLAAVTFQETKMVSKTEGMKGFFMDLTALAFTTKAEFPYEEFVRRTEARFRNGEIAANGEDKRLRQEIVVHGYNDDKEFAPAGFPPEFPEKMFDYLKASK